LILTGNAWAVQNEIAVGLANKVIVACSFTMGVGGPNRVVIFGVNNEVCVALNDSIELAILTGKLLIGKQNFSRMKLVASTCMIDGNFSGFFHHF
jgi:hypothetical protein